MILKFEEKGAFFVASGAARSTSESYSNKKLCFTTINQELLKEVLTTLCNREDCYFVKYSKSAKAGMYLGRCFLTNSKAVGEVWRAYRSHPELYCNIQDDDFTKQFR